MEGDIGFEISANALVRHVFFIPKPFWPLSKYLRSELWSHDSATGGKLNMRAITKLQYCNQRSSSIKKLKMVQQCSESDPTYEIRSARIEMHFCCYLKWIRRCTQVSMVQAFAAWNFSIISCISAFIGSDRIRPSPRLDNGQSHLQGIDFVICDR